MREIKEQRNNGDGTATVIFGDWIVPTYGVDCLICGKFVPCSITDPGAKICDECKQAVIWVKEKMKEKDNG